VRGRGRGAAERHSALAVGRREFGLSVECDPIEALADALRAAAGDAAFWRREVAKLADQLEPDGLLARGMQGSTTVHPFVAEHNGAQLRLARIAKMCLDVGLDARRVQLAERQGELIADVIRKVLDDPDLGLTATQRRAAGQSAALHLRAVAAAGDGAAPVVSVSEIPSGDVSPEFVAEVLSRLGAQGRET
jgi:hypothetical protein